MSESTTYDRMLDRVVWALIASMIAYAVPIAITSIIVPAFPVSVAHEVLDGVCYDVGGPCPSHTDYSEETVYAFGFRPDYFVNDLVVDLVIGLAMWLPIFGAVAKYSGRYFSHARSQIIVGGTLGMAICLIRESLRSEWRGGVWVTVAAALTLVGSLCASRTFLHRFNLQSVA